MSYHLGVIVFSPYASGVAISMGQRCLRMIPNFRRFFRGIETTYETTVQMMKLVHVHSFLLVQFPMPPMFVCCVGEIRPCFLFVQSPPWLVMIKSYVYSWEVETFFFSWLNSICFWFSPVKSTFC